MANRLAVYKTLRSFSDYINKHKEVCVSFFWVLCFSLVPVGGGYPFGFALYLAMDKHSGAGLAALCLAAVLADAPLICIPVAAGIYLFKLTGGDKSARLPTRPIAAGIAMGFVWASGISDGIYTLAQSTPWLVLTPMFTVLYGFALGGQAKRAMRHGGYLAILFTFVLAVTALFPLKFAGQALALLISFVAADKGGMLYGGLYAFTAGLGCGTGCAAVCGVTGLCGGLFSVSGRLGVLLCGTVTGMCAGFYFYGPQNCLGLFWAYLVAIGLFWLIKDKLSLFPLGQIPIEADRGKSAGTPLAEAFFAISQSARKSANKESEAARTADQYAGISTLLATAEEKREAEEHTDNALSGRAAALLYGAGVRAKSVKVTGGRKKQLVATEVELSRLTLSSTQLKQMMSDALGCKMKEPQFYPMGGVAKMVMESAPGFRIECSRNGCPKKGEEVSGDTVSFFSGADGYFYALISDGMGSGRAAAESSRLAGLFLEKLLSAGADRKTALALLNGFLASRKEEVFATVDLFEADLYTGKGVLVKAGAAPSFIIRGGKCRKLQSATAPAGIIRDIKAEQLSFDLKDGDTLIMLSDGISGDGNGEETEALLSNLKGERHTAAIADLLLSDGARRTGNCDDMSVCVIKVLSADKNAA